ncbi:DUF4434 domain-containing protein [Paenibacillus sp. 1011MAR3C5]|uniref:DUF4434 domain-containing protein n=1 Tax=Paenibacillus sp. 1011MAR3C5 TaxID=1675787 RepID=UPI000E6CEDF5|nr:DUF4434 domain-containing protein [Paenibacillus sp. 1011MAR3C5]RJE82831.1 DUF4434 domain-containing protein [Paenibacillus sp. 1011MAR3C5]
MKKDLWLRSARVQMIKVLCLTMIVVWFNPLGLERAVAAGANLIAGKSYASSMAANASYPDSGGVELTDGITAAPLLADAAWQGRLTPGSYSFTVDLGAAQTFQRFEAGFFKYAGGGIPAPTSVEYSYSADNAVYQPACSVGQQGAGSDIVRLTYSCDSAAPATARYVKMTVSGTPGSWSFVDEWKVLEAEPAPANVLKLNGSFLQPELGDQWSNTQWEDEFQYMKEVGMDHLILQWSANTEFGTAVYPTTVTGLTQETSQDVVAKALQMGEEYGLDIYIGLQLNHEWFANYTNNVAWLDEEAGIASELIEDLWNQYSSYDSFKGWYLSFEVDNWNLPDAASWQRMADFYNDVTTVAHTVSPGLPIMISPFYNVSGGLNPSGWQTMWNYILSRTDIDILALQDGIGAGHAVTSDLASWFAATKNAITASSPGTALWADTETFNTDFRPMDMQLMLDNMLAVEPYVSHYTSFSFNHYMSPQTVNPLYYETYADYVATGVMDSAAPTTPSGLTATAADAMTVNLNWSSSTDNTGVVGYQIYRNSELVYADYTAAASFVDKQLTPGISYTYAVRAFDAAGNLSALSSSVSVTTPAGTTYPNNWSAGRSYASSMPADAAYPDSGGTELTNGAYGSASYVDGAWQGRNTASPYSFVIDLGQVRTISELNANFLQVKSVYVLLPKEVRFSVSSDNITFTNAGTVEKPAVSSSDQTKTYRVTGLSGVSGRYVKVEVVPASSAWTFIDEIQARS